MGSTAADLARATCEAPVGLTSPCTIRSLIFGTLATTSVCAACCRCAGAKIASCPVSFGSTPITVSAVKMPTPEARTVPITLNARLSRLASQALIRDKSEDFDSTPLCMATPAAMAPTERELAARFLSRALSSRICFLRSAISWLESDPAAPKPIVL